MAISSDDLYHAIALDPGISLIAAKAYLSSHGFTHDFGTEQTQNDFQHFVDDQVGKDHTYAGKSVDLGHGGRAAIFAHKQIISGQFGKSLDDISMDDWVKIKEASRANYFAKYGTTA